MRSSEGLFISVDGPSGVGKSASSTITPWCPVQDCWAPGQLHAQPRTDSVTTRVGASY